MYPSQRGQGSSNQHYYQPYNPSHYNQVNYNPNNGNNASSSSNVSLGARAAHALTSALADPYGQTRAFYSYTNPNYAQAYFSQMQMQQQRPWTTEEGYTLSSTYDPSSNVAPSSGRGQNFASHIPTRTASHRPHEQQRPQHPPRHRPPIAGDVKCTYPGCSFSGSKQTVEIHRMDRHLIYPPGWKKKTDDWDTDPSLKGKLIPILGTGLVLDTPESIDAWVAERKKRWPSKRNVSEKEKREKEAEQRGEINPSDLSASVTKGSKRRRLGNTEGSAHRGQQRSFASSSYKRPKTADKVNDNEKTSEDPETFMITTGTKVNPLVRRRSDNVTNPASGTPVLPFPPNPVLEPTSSSSFPSNSANRDDHDHNHDDDDSNSDIDPVKDAVSSKRSFDIPEAVAVVEEQCENTQATMPGPKLSVPHRTSSKNKVPPQPKGPSRNPFASKNSLLRNLLLPEIRQTVSNLSQAIHFLAENDFLAGVELKPGDADTALIRVLDTKDP